MKVIQRFVGLDVHKDTSTIAVADGGRAGDEARQRGDGHAAGVPPERSGG